MRAHHVCFMIPAPESLTGTPVVFSIGRRNGTPGSAHAGGSPAARVASYRPCPPSVPLRRRVSASLKPDGRLVLVEFRKESAWVPIREEHKMSVKEARMELEAEGYRFDRVLDVLPWQHILVFRR